MPPFARHEPCPKFLARSNLGAWPGVRIVRVNLKARQAQPTRDPMREVLRPAAKFFAPAAGDLLGAGKPRAMEGRLRFTRSSTASLAATRPIKSARCRSISG
jgi:hypothetical protein